MFGVPQQVGFLDGDSWNSLLREPSAIVCMDDKNSLFVTDYRNHCVRMIKLNRSTIQTIAGDGNQGYKDGFDDKSQFFYPLGLAIHADQKRLFVADRGNHLIRQIDISAHRRARLKHLQTEELAPLFEVTTLCGTPNVFGMKDGIGENSKMWTFV